MTPEPADPAGTTFRTQRLKVAWLVVVPFLYLARPSPGSLVAGALFSIAGLLLRAVAAGSIHKDRELAKRGVYSRLRHPLYVGSYLVGMGFSLAGGRWWFPLAFTIPFVWLYVQTIKSENRALARRFGEEYELYRRQVPAVVPRFGGEAPLDLLGGFRVRLYRRNREWQALTGTVLGFGILWARMYFMN